MSVLRYESKRLHSKFVLNAEQRHNRENAKITTFRRSRRDTQITRVRDSMIMAQNKIKQDVIASLAASSCSFDSCIVIDSDP